MDLISAIVNYVMKNLNISLRGYTREAIAQVASDQMRFSSDHPFDYQQEVFALKEEAISVPSRGYKLSPMQYVCLNQILSESYWLPPHGADSENFLECCGRCSVRRPDQLHPGVSDQRV